MAGLGAVVLAPDKALAAGAGAAVVLAERRGVARDLEVELADVKDPIELNCDAPRRLLAPRLADLVTQRWATSQCVQRSGQKRSHSAMNGNRYTSCAGKEQHVPR